MNKPITLLTVAFLALTGAVIYSDWNDPPDVSSKECKTLSEANIRDDKYDLTGLMRAARDGDTEKIRQWLKEGTIHLEARDQFGNTPLMYAAHVSGDAETVRVLLEAGANTEKADSSHNTPLMGAAQAGHTEAMKVLIEAGADINARNVDGRTALMWAAFKKQPEAVKLLIEAGADEADIDYERERLKEQVKELMRWLQLFSRDLEGVKE